MRQNRHRLLFACATCATLFLTVTMVSAQQPPLRYYCAGDADNSGDINLADVVLLANYLFARGDEPSPFYLLGDADCSGDVVFLDATILMRYLYKDGSRVCEFCGNYLDDSSGAFEAQSLAMSMAGTLEPDSVLTERLRSDIQSIRIVLNSEEPALNSVFMFPRWPEVSTISVYFDSTDAHAVLDSAFHEWDSLNSALGVDSMWQGLWFEGQVYAIKLRFAGIRNPTVLAEYYDALPSVLYTSQGGFAGSPNLDILPFVASDTVTYLLTQGWGDCPSGCINGRYWYVKSVPDSIWFVGTYESIYSKAGTLPDWWKEVCRNWETRYPGLLCNQ